MVVTRVVLTSLAIVSARNVLRPLPLKFANLPDNVGVLCQSAPSSQPILRSYKSFVDKSGVRAILNIGANSVVSLN